MPVQTTYPGVYIEEIPSGVRTITGVSTAVTAFFGEAPLGPINKSVLITSYSEYEDKYGGIYEAYELGYAVKQYFLNGGQTGIITRLAKNSAAAETMLHSGNGAETVANQSLKVNALHEGKQGNNLKIEVDNKCNDPVNEFNLTVHQTNGKGIINNETHANLSMNSKKVNYVEKINSKFIEIKRIADTNVLAPGNIISANIDNPANAISAESRKLTIEINGLDPITITLDFPLPAGDSLTNICNDIMNKVILAANGQEALVQFNCMKEGASKIKLTSGVAEENSYVKILKSSEKDASAQLKLRNSDGAIRTDATSSIRPREYPSESTFLTSGVLGASDVDNNFLTETNRSFKISLDGDPMMTVVLEPKNPMDATNLEGRLNELAGYITDKVKSLDPGNPKYECFKCETDSNKLILTSASKGSNSKIKLDTNNSDIFIRNLKLLPPDVTLNQAHDKKLTNGNDDPIDNASLAAIYKGNRANREGIYTLESQDIFNIMVLPGISNFGVLSEAEAYCRERRAFLIIDAPKETVDTTGMKTVVENGDLPSSDHSAVYFPWLLIEDPLQDGLTVSRPPSGSIAGLFSRTDTSRGVWKAPAGTDALLRGVRGLSYQMTDMQNGILNPLGVNCIRKFPVYGTISWGARTLDGADAKASEWKYISIRRTSLYIEESLYRGLKWVVFEPNDEPLWAQIRLNVGAFMHNLFRQGAFQGKKKEAYFVKCDSETTTKNDINLGVVNIVVGFSPLKPAEFVIIKLQQIAGQIET